MKTTILSLLAIMFSFFTEAQTCNSNTFNSPGAPSSCTYTYTASGWENASGTPILAPVSIEPGESVCILANNSDTIGSSKFKGTLYVADGVTFSGSVPKFTDAIIVVEGTANFTIVNPDIDDTDIYVHETGFLRVPGQLQPNGASEIHVVGELENGADLNITGTAKMVIYENGKVTIANGAQISNETSNCGILIVNAGEVHTGGGSSLVNLCSLFVREDLVLDGPYVNDGLIVVKGDLSFNGHTLFNNQTLMVKNLYLNNDDIVGNSKSSTLLVETQAEMVSGSSVTGHYFFDQDDGGGFDVVCASCTEEVNLLYDVDMSGTAAQLTADCGAGLKPNTIIEKATLDFDGIDDYVQTDEFIKGQSEVTIMAWVKADVANAGKPVTIAGEDITCRLYLGNGTPIFGIRTTSSASGVNVSGSPIAYDEWHHIAGSFSGTTGKMNLYIDGKLVKSTNSGLSGTITSTALSEGKFEIGRVSRAVADRQYFKGDIDEVRVFDQVLTTDQIQRMVYQEIQESTGNVRGSVIGKDVVDITSNTKVLWNNLVAYYPMTDIISYERTTDYSMYERFTTLHNITTFLEQTAPMPYETKQSGNWTTEATWLHGDVWDIEAVASNKDWSIVRVNSGDALATGNSHTNIGTIIEDGGSLTITGDKALTNSWYFELNGSIDLQGDSQLIQGEYSDLVTSANGKLLRRQDSNDNVYRYTYVSSPVGSQSATTLGNDNGNTNNANNTSFSLSMLKKGDGTPVQFTSAYNENGKMSTRWTYTFINGTTYYDWASLDPATAINPGEGYIHKGMGNGGATQEFLYEGRPNNGTILIAADDVDGDSGNESQPDVTQTTTLIGNPYPSAIDAHKFIDDNAAVIDGTLYLWQHWGGDSHILNEYEGGYATINKMTKIRAYQFVGKSGADNGSMDGTITPKQYIAPGQSFMAEVIADGNIEFNNAQRVYKRESVGETAFFRTSENDKATATERTTENDSTELKVLGLEFRMSNDLTREFVLGFSPETTMDFDYGYDAKMMAVKSDDMYTMWTDQKMIAQAYPEITTETEIPLHMVTTGAHTYELSATELTGFEDLDVYLWDKYNDTYFDLAAGGYYAFTSEAGEYTDRFAIVFETNDTLSEEEVMLEDTLIYYNTKLDKLFVRGLKENSKRISLTDMSGKTIQQFSDLSTSQLEDGLRITNISSGIYMASVVTDTNRIINKKIIID